MSCGMSCYHTLSYVILHSVMLCYVMSNDVQGYVMYVLEE